MCAKACGPDPGRARPCHRSPQSASTRTWSAWPPLSGALRREHRGRSPRSPQRSRPAGPRWRSSSPTSRDAVSGRGRDGHGHRPGRVPGRPVRPGLRGGSGGARGLRPRPSRGDPGDRRAGHPGQRSRASWLAMLAGTDFIKTSTGKIAPRPRRQWRWSCSPPRGTTPRPPGAGSGWRWPGGVRTAKDAIRYLVLVKESPGPGIADARPVPGSAPPACSTTCSCSAANSSPAGTPGPDYFTID